MINNVTMVARTRARINGYAARTVCIVSGTTSALVGVTHCASGWNGSRRHFSKPSPGQFYGDVERAGLPRSPGAEDGLVIDSLG